MSDSIEFHHQFDNLSDKDHRDCNFPFVIARNHNEDGEIVREYYDQEFATSLTGAKYKVTATPDAGHTHKRRVGGYAVEINTAACLIGRNHLLVNGVYRATEGALELLKYHAAQRGCTQFGLTQFKMENILLTSVTGTFLLEFGTPEEALAHLQELRDHAYGVFNHVSSSTKGKSEQGSRLCFPVGPDDCFTLYIRQRKFRISCYIKQPDVKEAFATFPNAEIERELKAKALTIVRVEVIAHGAWLKDNDLSRPEDWKDNPAAYKKLFNLARTALRLDENLRVRAPSEATICKLKTNPQKILRAHLSGKDAREHELVLDCSGSADQVITARNKKFSAFKRDILKQVGVDISIPWSIQSTKLSPHMKDWFVYPGEYVPSEHLAEHIPSRVSVPKAIAGIKAKTNSLMREKSKGRPSGIGNAPLPPEGWEKISREFEIGLFVG